MPQESPLPSQPHLTELPYHPDGADYFACLVAGGQGAFLDSGPPGQRLGRYDIVAGTPDTTVTDWGEGARVEGRETGYYPAPLDALEAVLQSHRRRNPTRLPFTGGAIGYLGYELGRRLEGLSGERGPRLVPDLAFGIHDWVVVVDHSARRAWLAEWRGAGRASAFRRALAHDKASAGAPFQLTGPCRSNLDRAAYEQRFERVQAYLRAGDCYQINLARRFSGPVEGDAWATYQRLRLLSPAPYGAYLQFPEFAVLSNSPERFLTLRGDQAQTAPIKGTRPRDPDPVRDRAQAMALAASAKDRAENLMIVDLLRNDFGKVCRPGSVRVPELFKVESFATVHHLVSRVTGRLQAGRSALDLVRAAFPGGSITGAPKRRAMEIIEELEPDPRGVYCGAIGYLGFDGGMDLNVAIRTLTAGGGRASYYAGGGVVVDSRSEDEFRETTDKALAMERLLAPRVAAAGN